MWQFTGKSRPNVAIEPQEGQESVWDYPRPPICANDEREILCKFQGQIIAKTNKAIRVLETASPPTVYIPRNDVNMQLLVKGYGSSFCEWKGAATYWSINSDDSSAANVGWSYESPSQPFKSIAGYISFYPAKLDCRIGGEIVRPQPGNFYGGWVTNEIVGPFKGEARTGGW